MMKQIYLYGTICLLIVLLIGCIVCYGSDMADAEAFVAELDAEWCQEESEWQQDRVARDAGWQQAWDDREAEYIEIIEDLEAEYIEFLETEYQQTVTEAIEERDAEWERILQQAIADRDAEWEQAIRQNNDEEALDLIMEILPYILI